MIEGDSILGGKLIREAHEKIIHGLGTHHQGVEATIAALQTGEKGVFIPQARKHVGDYILLCKKCNETRSWTYTTKLQDKYTKNIINAVPFKKISVDMLGPIDAKMHPVSRNTYKVYPLLIKCIETGALWAGLIEGAGTSEVVKMLIK